MAIPKAIMDDGPWHFLGCFFDPKTEPRATSHGPRATSHEPRATSHAESGVRSQTATVCVVVVVCDFRISDTVAGMTEKGPG